MRNALFFICFLPLFGLAEESSALRQSVGRIESYCQSIDGSLSSINSYSSDILGELSDIAISASFTQNQLRTFYSNFVAFASSELNYSEGSYYSLLDCESYLLTIQDELQNNIYPICSDIGIDVSSLLSSFTSLRTEFSSYSTQVLSSLASIDSNVEQILGAITNRAASVVYDLSFLTNYTTRTSLSLVSGTLSGLNRGYRWYNAFDGTLRTSSTIAAGNYVYPQYRSLSQYLLLESALLSYFMTDAFPQQVKSGVITALAANSISNDVGRLVIQGDLLTNRVDTISKNTFWISNYLDRVLSVTQKQITNDTGRMLVILEHLTNHQFSVSVQQKEQIQQGVDYSTETADSIEEPGDFNGPVVSGLTFDLSNVKAFVDAIPTYDFLPAQISFSYTDEKGSPVQWSCDVAPYGAICTAIRAVSSLMTYGVTLTLVIVGVKWIFHILIFIAGLIPSVDKV